MTSASPNTADLIVALRDVADRLAALERRMPAIISATISTAEASAQLGASKYALARLARRYPELRRDDCGRDLVRGLYNRRRLNVYLTTDFKKFLQGKKK